MRNSTEPVVVIGGGFAGLSAATALAEAGVGVHVVEARPTLGGRANAFRDPATGERIDNGQHVLAGCYTETLRFLRRVGSIQHLHWPSTLRVPMIDEGGRRTELVFPPLPAPFDLLAAVLAWDALGADERWSILRVGRALRGSTEAPAQETVRQWLERHHQSPRLCRLLWEPLALAALNQSIDQAAAASFLAVTRRLFGSEPDAATLLLPAVPLDDLFAGPSRAFLERSGSQVSTNATGQVVFHSNSVSGVRTPGGDLRARIVICAVPWFAMTETLPAPPDSVRVLIGAAARLQSSPIVTVNLWFERDADLPPLIGLPGRTFQWVFARRRLVGDTQSHLSLVCSGAEAICAFGNPEIIDIALREIREAIPALMREPLRHALVVRERRATFSLQPGGPPRPATLTPIPGLLLAGDWIATGLPATIESAVASGHAAARAALDLVEGGAD